MIGLIAMWTGGFMAQLLIAVLLTWALRKLFKIENPVGICAATVIASIPLSMWGHDDYSNARLVESMITYVPTILPVYLMLTRKQAKPANA